MTSYLRENEAKKQAKNLRNGDIHLAQIPDFKMRYLKNHLFHIYNLEPANMASSSEVIQVRESIFAIS